MKLMTTLLIGALALSSIVVASADPLSNPWSVKVGAGWPMQAAAKSDEGNTVLTAGLAYGLAKSNPSAPLMYSVYSDYAGGSNNGGHIYSYSLGLSARTFFSKPAGDTKNGCSPYAGIGVGAYAVDDSYNNNSKTVVNAGGKLFLGAEISGIYLVEVNYNWLPDCQGANPGYFGTQIGLRF